MRARTYLRAHTRSLRERSPLLASRGARAPPLHSVLRRRQERVSAGDGKRLGLPRFDEGLGLGVAEGGEGGHLVSRREAQREEEQPLGGEGKHRAEKRADEANPN